MDRDGLRLTARMLHNLHCALGHEELVVTSHCLEQQLSLAQGSPSAKLGQRGDLDIVEGGKSNQVQVVLGHISTSVRGQRAWRLS